MKTLQILIGISIVFYLIIILVLNPICQQKGYAHMSIDGCYNYGIGGTIIYETK